jgi:hypothetical protein
LEKDIDNPDGIALEKKLPSMRAAVLAYIAVVLCGVVDRWQKLAEYIDTMLDEENRTSGCGNSY